MPDRAIPDRPSPVRRSRLGDLVVVLVVTALTAAGCSSGSGSRRRSATAHTLAVSEPSSTATPVAGPGAVTTGSPAVAVPTTAAPPPVITTTTARPAAPAWAACQNGFECATLSPPLDYDHPDGRTAKLALIRLRASGPPTARIGSVFVNPGGPGASAVAFARAARSFIRPAVLARFDVVAFDPRGTGASSPIVCERGPDLDAYFAVDPTPDDAAERQRLIDVSRRFAEDCAARVGALLGHVDTRTAARDMDYVRAAIGDDKVSYLGYSYGTLLGAMYADLFPARVRAFVLDGAIDPALDVEQINRQQAAGFERSFNAFFADCAAHASCPLQADGDPHTVFDALDARLDTTPLVVGARTVGSGELFLAVVSALYRQSDWASLAAALHAADSAGDGAALLRMADEYTQRQPDGSYGSLLSANAAVNCIDRPWSTNVADYDADAESFKAESPEFGAALAYGSLICAFWKVAPVDRQRPLRAAGAAPILVVGTTDDPATPYVWAQSLASELESGRLLTNHAQGHTSLSAPNACVTDAVTAYVLNLTVPTGEC